MLLRVIATTIAISRSSEPSYSRLVGIAQKPRLKWLSIGKRAFGLDFLTGWWYLQLVLLVPSGLLGDEPCNSYTERAAMDQGLIVVQWLQAHFHAAGEDCRG